MLSIVVLFSILFVVVFIFFMSDFIGWFGSMYMVCFCYVFVLLGFCFFFVFYFSMDMFFDVSFGLFIDGPSLLLFEGFSFSFNVYIDGWNSNILLALVLISLFVHVFGFSYMSFDSSRVLFFVCLSLFVFSMSFLLTVNHLLLLFVGFELIGWVSFILISWFYSIDSLNSACNAVVLSRFSDLVLVWLICDVFSSFNSFMFDVLYFSFFLFCNVGWMVFIVILANSAVWPFSSWLVWAMAGPTPVSSLLHSATLVTSSFVLVNHFYISIFGSVLSGYWVVLFVLNICCASLFCLFSVDVNKLVAYSTMSQISLLLLFYVYVSSMSYIYLIAHGFVKCSIFMLVGYNFHSLVGQDFSSSAGSYGSLCFVSILLGLCWLVLSALPSSLMFFCNEFLFDFVIISDSFSFIFLFLFNLVIYLTCFYCLWIFSVFFGIPAVNSFNFNTDWSLFISFYLVLWFLLYYTFVFDLSSSYVFVVSGLIGLCVGSFFFDVVFRFFIVLNFDGFYFGGFMDFIFNFFGYFFLYLVWCIFIIFEFFLIENSLFFFVGLHSSFNSALFGSFWMLFLFWFFMGCFLFFYFSF